MSFAKRSRWRRDRLHLTERETIFIMAGMLPVLPIPECTAFIACHHVKIRARTRIDFSRIHPVSPFSGPMLRLYKDKISADVRGPALATLGARRDTGRSSGANDR